MSATQPLLRTAQPVDSRQRPRRSHVRASSSECLRQIRSTLLELVPGLGVGGGCGPRAVDVDLDSDVETSRNIHSGADIHCGAIVHGHAG